VTTFPCGDTEQCEIETQYCQQTVGGAVGNPPSYQCLPLPDGCLPQTCECLSNVPCAEICEIIDDAGAMVTCQAP
jgi:hypothetical protein